MALSAIEMVGRVRDRTSYKNDKKIVGELASSADWAYNRVFNSANGPNQFLVPAEEVTISSRTQTYNLGAALAGGNLYGVKLLWLKFSSDTVFTPMVPLDSGDLRFIAADNVPDSDTTTVATGHPVFYDVLDFAQVRFAPALPACTIRASYWIKPTPPDPTANNAQGYASRDALEPTHEAIVDKATAQIFRLLSDDRSLEYVIDAERKLVDALHVVGKRVAGPITTQPFPHRRRR